MLIEDKSELLARKLWPVRVSAANDIRCALRILDAFQEVLSESIYTKRATEILDIIKDFQETLALL